MRTKTRPPKLFAGPRLRRAREARGLTQAALAEAIGLSASYLNQIESDDRPIPARLIGALCDTLGVGVGYFDDSAESHTAHDLREATADPIFGAPALDAAQALAAVRHAPDFVERFLMLYRHSLSRLEENHAPTHSSHQAGAGQLGAQSYEEVRDWVQSHRNHFDALDRAAETMAHRLGLGGVGNSGTILADHLLAAHGLRIDDDASLLGSGMFWRLHRRAGRLSLADSARGPSRTFWLAHVIALLEQRRLIEHTLRATMLSSDESRSLARVSLANYFAGALLMPYRIFLEAAREVRYDIERLQTRFGASFEQVCHRLSTMQRPDLPGLPFFFLKTDIAGNVLKRSSATRFQFARFGGPCPLWNVYAAFAAPGRIHVDLARTPDEVTYLNIARTVGSRSRHHHDRPRAVAVVLGCEIEYARLTTYADGLLLSETSSATPIGPGCRACERTDCRHRAVPPVGHALDIGTVERGVVPYRITPVEASRPY